MGHGKEQRETCSICGVAHHAPVPRPNPLAGIALRDGMIVSWTNKGGERHVAIRRSTPTGMLWIAAVRGIWECTDKVMLEIAEQFEDFKILQ